MRKFFSVLFILSVFAFAIIASIPTQVQAVSAWKVGVAYKVGDLVTYGGNTYKCIQAHTSQADWTPPATPALWQFEGKSKTPTKTPTKTATNTPTATATNTVSANLPDLTVPSLNGVLTGTGCGVSYSLNVVVKNIGTASAGAFIVSVAYSLNSATFTQTVNGLRAGQSITLTFPLNVGPVKVTADSTNLVTESNENNNSLQLVIDPPPPTPTCVPTQGPIDVTFSGHVTEYGAGTISGATVSYTSCHPRTFSAVTDSTGYYTFVVPASYACGSSLTAYAAGFAGYSVSVSNSISPQVINFSLMPNTPTPTPATLTPTPAIAVWQSGVTYMVGDLVQYNGSIYRCIQMHISDISHTPPNVPALWFYVGPVVTPTSTQTPTPTFIP